MDKLPQELVDKICDFIPSTPDQRYDWHEDWRSLANARFLSQAFAWGAAKRLFHDYSFALDEKGTADLEALSISRLSKFVRSLEVNPPVIPRTSSISPDQLSATDISSRLPAVLCKLTQLNSLKFHHLLGPEYDYAWVEVLDKGPFMALNRIWIRSKRMWRFLFMKLAEYHRLGTTNGPLQIQILQLRELNTGWDSDDPIEAWVCINPFLSDLQSLTIGPMALGAPPDRSRRVIPLIGGRLTEMTFVGVEVGGSVFDLLHSIVHNGNHLKRLWFRNCALSDYESMGDLFAIVERECHHLIEVLLGIEYFVFVTRDSYTVSGRYSGVYARDLVAMESLYQHVTRNRTEAGLKTMQYVLPRLRLTGEPTSLAQ